MIDFDLLQLLPCFVFHGKLDVFSNMDSIDGYLALSPSLGGDEASLKVTFLGQ